MTTKTNKWKLLPLRKLGLEIVETVDGEWMVLQNGFQKGGVVDPSGAGNLTFPSRQEALAYAERLTKQEGR